MAGGARFRPNDKAEIYIAIPCPAIGQATDEYLDLAGDLVTSSGPVTLSAKIGGSAG